LFSYQANASRDGCGSQDTVGTNSHNKQCLDEITQVAAQELKLTFNEKTQLFPLSQGVDYVGWHFYLTETGKVIRRLRTSNKRRFKRRMKAFAQKYRDGEMELEQIRQSLASYAGHLKHGHTYRLKRRVYSKLVLVRPSETVHQENGAGESL